MLLVCRSVFGRFDEGLDEEWVFGDPGGDEKDALGHTLLLQQGVLGTLPDELLEPSVALHQVLENCHSLVVAGAEHTVSLPPLVSPLT